MTLTQNGRIPPIIRCEHFESAWLCPSLFKLEMDRLSDSLNQSNPGTKFILIIDDNRLMKTSLEKNFENMEVLFLQANVGEKELVTKFKLSKPLLSNPGKLIQKIF